MFALLLALPVLPACWGDDGGGDDDDDDVCDQSGEGYWPSQSAAFECQVLTIVNQRRAEGGDCGEEGTFPASGPLAMDAQLRRAARLHSQDMGLRDYFAHESPGGPNGEDVVERTASAGFTGWTMLGENIAAGQTSADAVMEAWMGSDGHCSNILQPDYNLIGIGHAQVTGSQMNFYWTQDFAQK